MRYRLHPFQNTAHSRLYDLQNVHVYCILLVNVKAV